MCGRTPAASIASVPRLRWQNSAVNRVLQATCSQCSLPATRSPVSSACTSSASLSAARAAAVNGASPAAARAVQAATVPTDIGVPNTSASSAAVRSTGRCWPRTRYTAIAVACGPYCTGALTPGGPAARVRVPQPQRRDTKRCSTTRTAICGMSNTCRRTILAGGPSTGSVLPRPAAGERPAAARAGTLLVHHHLVGNGDLPQGAALPPRLTAGPAPGPAPQRLRRRLVQPVARRRLGGVARGGGQLPLQLRDPRILLGDAGVLLGDAGVLLGDPSLQLGDDPLLRRHERRQLLVGRSGHGPILHTATMITRLRHAAQDLNSHPAGQSSTPGGAAPPTSRGGERADPYPRVPRQRSPRQTAPTQDQRACGGHDD